MSIIYEALKKVERADLFRQNVSRNQQKPRPNRKLKILLIYLIVICAGIVIAKLSPLSPPTVQKKAEPITLVVPQAPQPKHTFVLNGVFFSDEEGYALINNKVVKEGDELDGRLVKKITMDEVELLEVSGSIIKLYTTH